MNRLNDDYVTGLWKKDLLRGLLWHAPGFIDDSLHLIEPQKYRAPTWSWASVDGAVIYSELGGDYHPLARVLEAITIPLSEDLTGSLKGGHIRMLGYLRQVFLEYSTIITLASIRFKSTVIRNY